MKRITALLHTARLPDILHALEAAGEKRISVLQARGFLRQSRSRQPDYSVELGDRVTQEIQLEVFCEDARLDAVVALIRRLGHTSIPPSGWVFVSDVDAALPIDAQAPG